jgi:hypothetical protein
MYGRKRALLSSPGGQHNLPFEDVETGNEAGNPSDGEWAQSVECMFADEFRVLEMRREGR